MAALGYPSILLMAHRRKLAVCGYRRLSQGVLGLCSQRNYPSKLYTLRFVSQDRACPSHSLYQQKVGGFVATAGKKRKPL